jgi:Predicted membrane protein
MNFLKNFLYGALIGVSSVIPGFSGGTAAALVGIYEKLLESISGFKNHARESLKFLIPLLLGIIVFALLALLPITWGINNYPFITVSLFAGIQLSGIPSFYKNVKHKTNKKNILYFILGVIFTLAIVLPAFFINSDKISLINPPFYMFIIMFLVGIVISCALVLPGVSGSMILFLLGLYVPLIDSIKGFFVSIGFSSNLVKLDNSQVLDVVHTQSYFWNNTLLLISFGIGVILGIFLISKLLTYLFNKFKTETYFVIFGFIVASFASIYFNKSLYVNFDYVALIFGIILLIVGFLIVYIPQQIVTNNKIKKLNEQKEEEIEN